MEKSGESGADIYLNGNMRVNTSDLGNEAITRYNGVQQCFVFFCGGL